MKSLICISSEHYSQVIFWQRTVATGLKYKDSSKVVSVRLEKNSWSCVGMGDDLAHGRIEHVDEYIVNYETIIEDLLEMKKKWSHALSIFWNLDIFKAYLMLPEEKRKDFIDLLNDFKSEQHFMYYSGENYDRCMEISQEFWDQINITQYEWPGGFNFIKYVSKMKPIFPTDRVDIVTDIIEERFNGVFKSAPYDWAIVTSEYAYSFKMPEKSNYECHNDWAAGADFASNPNLVGRDFLRIRRKALIRKMVNFFK